MSRVFREAIMRLDGARGPLSVAERQMFERREEEEGESFFAGTTTEAFLNHHKNETGAEVRHSGGRS